MSEKCYLCGKPLGYENFTILIEWENKKVHRSCYLKLKFYKTYMELIKNVIQMFRQNSRIYE